MSFLYNLKNKKSDQPLTLKKNPRALENVHRELPLPFHQAVNSSSAAELWHQLRAVQRQDEEPKPVKGRAELTSDALLRAQAVTLNRLGFQSLLDHEEM